MTRLGITNSWGGWNITGGTITNPGATMMVKLRNLVLFFMLLTVVAHILLYTDPAASFKTPFCQ
jgi:hypothetical protein